MSLCLVNVHTPLINRSGIFAALVLSHAVLVSLGTQVLARLQRLYILLNVWYVLHVCLDSCLTPRGSLCFVVIIALPIATPSEYRNSASYAFGDFTNCMRHLPLPLQVRLMNFISGGLAIRICIHSKSISASVHNRLGLSFVIHVLLIIHRGI